MIKRSGVEVMNERTKGVSIAKETLGILKDKRYTSLSGKVVDISGSLDLAIKNTKLYGHHFDFPTVQYPDCSPTIEVVNETTAQAAVRLAAAGKTNLVALNFASARNQGGGFLAGAIAQEEDLCRCSGLYACLKSKPVFYNENILCNNSYYTENIIYSPNVPFFRNEHNLFLEEPFELSIISAPAPNVRAMDIVDEEMLNTYLWIRVRRILQTAQVNGHRNVILGAWGCGAFGNNPEVISSFFMDLLEKIHDFDHVCFAVYDTRTPPHLFETFQKAIE